MDVVGIDLAEWCDDHVHTVDVWYSKRRQCWVVERLNHAGVLVGTAHCCASIGDAEACVSHWLRSHDEAHLVAAREAQAVADHAAIDEPTSRDSAAQRTGERRRRAA